MRAIIYLTLFLISNWMMDIMTWAGYYDSCASSGFYLMCDSSLWYHLFWYASIALFILLLIDYSQISKSLNR